MVFYFSSTGNSEYVAQRLAHLTGDRCQSIIETTNEFLITQVNRQSCLGIVFPVYGWDIPLVVKGFFDKLKANNMSAFYLYIVVTCGDDVGMIDHRIKKVLSSSDLIMNACFSIQAPNTFVCLPGFDVDNDKVRQHKLSNFDNRIAQIATKIANQTEETRITRGKMPHLKTYILGYLFRKLLLTDRFFHTTNNCTHCGLCAKICPLNNITMYHNSPHWHHQCTGCLACYHHCPRHAIRYGSQTNKKGQYLLKKHQGEIR